MSNALRAVVAGCGGMSNAWLKAATQIADLEIVGLIDIREEAALKRKELPMNRWFTTANENRVCRR